MHEIIKITRTNVGPEVKQTVNARELHSFLGVGKDFSTWIKDQITRARLMENLDFLVFPEKGENLKGGRPSLEYHLTLEAGKHVAMMSQTDKGFEVRDYFIECERRANDPMLFLNDPHTMRQLLLSYSEKVLELEEKVTVLEPKSTALDIISASDGSVLISRAAKILGYPQNIFFLTLADLKWISKRTVKSPWEANAGPLNRGYVEVKYSHYNDSRGMKRTNPQVRITPKGITQLAKKNDTLKERVDNIQRRLALEESIK